MASAALDAAAIGFVMPAVRQSLGIDLAAASWLLTLFVLGALVGAPVGAAAARAWGARTAFRAAGLCFAMGSALAAAAPGLAALLAARLLQGLGTGALLPVTTAIALDTWPPERHGRIVSALSLVYGVAFLGGIAGAPLLLRAGWRWIFVADVALAVAALALLGAIAGARAPDGARWDLSGLVTWVVALACLSLFVNQVQGGRAAGGAVAALTGVGLALVVTFVALQRRPHAAVLPVAMFRPREMRALVALSLGTGLGQAAVVLFPSLVVLRLDVTPAGSGTLMLPLVAGGLAAAVVAMLVLDRVGPRLLIAAGAITTAGGMAAGGAAPPTAISFLGATALLGLGAGWLPGALRYVGARAAAAGDRERAQAAVALLTNVGVLLGSAVAGAVAAGVGDQRRAAERAMLALAALTLAAFLPTARLRGRTGDDRG
jgi:MFS family permease